MKSFNQLTKQEKKEYLAILLLLPFAYIWHLFRKANFRTLPKRAVAVCLAAVMIVVMLPTTAFAADTHTHCICGGSVDGHTHDTTSPTWTAWNGTDPIAYTDGVAYVYLTGNAERSEKLAIEDDYTLYLCLGGYSLSPADGFSYDMFDINGTLNLADCAGGGKITGAESTSVYLRGGTLNMYGGAITEGNNSGVEVEHNGNFNMYGGEITNNKAYKGAGIYHSNGTIRISGGTITGNVAKQEGGAIFSNVSGIEICGNPVIAGNYAKFNGEESIENNIHAYTIDIVGAMTDGARIGMTLVRDELGFFTQNTYESSADYSKYFFSDKGYPVYREGVDYCFGYKFTKQPSGTDYTVEVNETNGASYQWYETILGAPVSVTETYIDDNDGMTMGSYGENGWTPMSDSGMCGYFAIAMNAGNMLTAKFASAPQGNVMLVEATTFSPVPVTISGENTYVFTVPADALYGLIVESDSAPNVEATLTTVSHQKVDNQNTATLDTTNLLAGTYACKVTWNMGTVDTIDDYTLTSAAVEYAAPPTYTVTWKNYDGSVLETDTGVTLGTTPTYNGATPQKAEDENFTYTFKGWSPALSTVTGDAEYIAQFTAVSKRVEPTYTVTIPATVNEGESFKVSATGVVLNTDQTLTVTLQSDFKFKNEQGAELGFKINDGAIVNNAQLISVTGNGDKNNPLSFTTENLTAEIAEEAKYSGIYSGNITFNIAVDTAENN